MNRGRGGPGTAVSGSACEEIPGFGRHPFLWIWANPYISGNDAALTNRCCAQLELVPNGCFTNTEFAEILPNAHTLSSSGNPQAKYLGHSTRFSTELVRLLTKSVLKRALWPR